MSENRKDREMNKQKRGLLNTMVQRKFENHVYAHLEKTNFENLESLDQWLDEALTNYLDEVDAIEAYYNSKE